MASFLTFNAAPPTVQISSADSRSHKDIIDINNMYKVLISNQSSDSPLQFSGYTPENFSIGLSSGWSAPFEGMSLLELGASGVNTLSNLLLKKDISNVVDPVATKSGQLLKFAGMSSMSKLLSAQVWDAPGFLTVELPIFLDAYEDTKVEVVQRLVTLLSLAAPEERYGVLVPPGPSPMKQVFSEAVSMASGSALTGVGLTSPDVKSLFDDKEAFTVTIGNFFSMFPAVVESVSMSTENVFDAVNGKPVSADIMVSFKSYFAVTRKDLREWFGIDQ